MLPVITWHGTPAQWQELQKAAQNNCTCEHSNEDGVQTTECLVHYGLRCDQRLLDRLLFARTIAERLRIEEWSR